MVVQRGQVLLMSPLISRDLHRHAPRSVRIPNSARVFGDQLFSSRRTRRRSPRRDDRRLETILCKFARMRTRLCGAQPTVCGVRTSNVIITYVNHTHECVSRMQMRSVSVRCVYPTCSLCRPYLRTIARRIFRPDAETNNVLYSAQYIVIIYICVYKYIYMQVTHCR